MRSGWRSSAPEVDQHHGDVLAAEGGGHVVQHRPARTAVARRLVAAVGADVEADAPCRRPRPPPTAVPSCRGSSSCVPGGWPVGRLTIFSPMLAACSSSATASSTSSIGMSAAQHQTVGRRTLDLGYQPLVLGLGRLADQLRGLRSGSTTARSTSTRPRPRRLPRRGRQGAASRRASPGDGGWPPRWSARPRPSSS